MRNGSMTNVIFIHGLGQTPASWDKTVSSLSEYITADYVNLSSICKNGEVTYKNLYCAFEKYCEIVEPLNLCGISLGAILALNYAIDHTEKVWSLVLIAPQYEIPRLLLKLQNIIFFFMPKAYFQKLGFTKKEFICLVNSMLDLDFRNDLSNISCTTLVICGEKDKANRKSAIGLANSISMSDLHLIKNAGHEVNIEVPNKLAAILKSFYFSCPFLI
ncbi:MAG: alpha/beta hydrolase [Eubacteriales bacterium]|nr:alpha/beta hydrolase [Eubacteriales bacterium]